MKLDSEFLFNGPREKVWDILQDPDVLVVAVPGTKSLKKLAEGEFEGEMNVKVGPLNGIFLGKVVLSDRIPPQSYTINVEAKGPLGFGNGSGKVELLEQGEGATLMKYSIELQVGGKLASVGQRLLETVGKSISKQSLEALNHVLKERLSGSDAPKTYTSPSQSAFAMGVAKNVMVEMMCSKTTWVVFTVLALAIALGIWFYKR